MPSVAATISGDEGAGTSVVAAKEGMILIPYVPQVDRGEPLSKFQQMLLERLDTLTIKQRNHREFCATQFQHLENQIEVIQEQLAELVEDEIAYFLTVIAICFRKHLIILSFIILIFPI